MQRTVDDALEERLHYVEKHRASMLRDAREDVETRRARYLAHVREIPALRGELIEARETFAWAATYPDSPDQYGFPSALALGLLEPVQRTLETTARIEFGRVVAALEADADALADRHHEQVQRALGTAPPPTPLTEAMWTETEQYKTWRSRSGNVPESSPSSRTRTS